MPLLKHGCAELASAQHTIPAKRVFILIVLRGWCAGGAWLQRMAGAWLWHMARTTQGILVFGSEAIRVGYLLSFILFFAVFGLFFVLFRAFDKA
ncbi:MAG: hypothetical protein ACYCYO_10560 [Bacilli bacterium]